MNMPTSLSTGAVRQRLSEDLSQLIDSKELGLTAIHKSYLRLRWLIQTLQLEREAERARTRHHALRLITVIGSLLLVMLVTLRFSDAMLGVWAHRVYYLTVVLSLMVAVSVAIEQMFNFGERARVRRAALEKLQTEGWGFLQLSGRYNRFASHEEAFAAFANQIESLSRRDPEVFVPEVVRDRRVGNEGGGGEATEKKSVSYSRTAAVPNTVATTTGRESSTHSGVRTITPSAVEPTSIQ